MRYIVSILVVYWGLAAVYAPLAVAITTEQYDRNNALGRLNGVALHCGYLEEMRRMKQALIDNLPKRRELGLAFDRLTNESYLDFIKRAEDCPRESTFASEVKKAIQLLKDSF